MPIFPKPPGAAPGDSSTQDDVLKWFDAVEKLELQPSVSQAIMNRLVHIICESTYIYLISISIYGAFDRNLSLHIKVMC